MTDQTRLTEAAHWNEVHRARRLSAGLRRLARRALGEERFAFLSHGGYPAFVVNESILGPHLLPGARVLEIGSAPALHLAKLATRFQCDPWGIELSEVGVRANRAALTDFGFDPSQVIHGDFFSDSVIARHRRRYDIVMSNGFIEHFREVRDVVARHVELVRPGSLLAVSIPNLKGVNAALMRFFNSRLLDIHNQDIMSYDSFAALFDGLGLRQLHCGYVGLFQLGLQAAPSGSLQQHVLRAGTLLQLPLDLVQRRLFGTRNPQIPWASPYLHFLGRLDS